MELNEIEKRKLILDKFNENPNRSQRSIAKELKFAKSTVNDVLSRFRSSLTLERKYHDRKKPGPWDRISFAKVKRSLDLRPGLSDRMRGDAYGTSRENGRNWRKRLGYNSYHAKKAPNRNDLKESDAKSRARKLYYDILTNHEGCIMQDDETNVPLDLAQLPGQKCYVAKERGDADDKYTLIKKDKFPKKAMFWQALCSCGKKSGIFVTQGTINSSVYIEECLKKLMLPLYNSHDIKPLFWPDLASCHYSKTTLKWFEDNEVLVVPKTHNPPNCPELRGIEIYWGIVKQKLKNNGRAAPTVKSLKEKFKRAAQSIPEDLVRKLVGDAKRKIRIFAKGEN